MISKTLVPSYAIQKYSFEFDVKLNISKFHKVGCLHDQSTLENIVHTPFIGTCSGLNIT